MTLNERVKYEWWIAKDLEGIGYILAEVPPSLLLPGRPEEKKKENSQDNYICPVEIRTEYFMNVSLLRYL
jgi:hypothetical protein